MADLHLVAVAVSAVGAFVLSAVYYGALAGQPATAEGDTPEPPAPVVALVELARNLVVAVVVGWLVVRTGIDEWPDGVGLGLALWVGFPLVLWIGAIVHERTPVATAALHAGDWLAKLLLVAAITAAWQ